MKELIIVGAGGFGREAFYLARTIGKWIIKGFIDDNLTALDGIKIGSSIIGKISDWQPSDREEFVLGIASPHTKEVVSNFLKNKGAQFVTIIGPDAYVNEDAEIGEGVVMTSGSVGAGTKIGNFVHIAGSMIGQDAEVGDYSTTTAFANLTNAKIGKKVFIGSHAVILNNIKVGDEAYICAGSIVFNNIKLGVKVLGNPARKFEI